MPSVSPSSCVGLMENRHYRDDEEHLYAVAEALREEYQAIVAAGFIVQIDDPRLGDELHAQSRSSRWSSSAPGRRSGSRR